MSISFISAKTSNTVSNGTTTLAASMPSGVQAGDQLLAVVAVVTGANTDAPFSTVPSGWSRIGGQYDAGPAQGIRVDLFQRTATGSEAASYTWGAPAVYGHITASILAYRGANPILTAELVTAHLGGGTGAGSTVRSTGTLNLSGSQTSRRLISVFADRVGSTQTWPAVPDTTRVLNTAGNASYVIADTNGGVAAGASYSKSATAGTSTNTGVQLLVALQATQNTPPTVSAGGDVSGTVGAHIPLDGTATDPDGTIASHTWSITSKPTGATATINDPTALSTYVVGDTPGNYVAQLTATDNTGGSASDTRAISLSGTGAPPTAAGTLDPNWAVFDATTSAPGSSGTLSYTISPSTGAIQWTPGKFLIPRDTSTSNRVITVTESGTGQIDQISFNVPAAGALAAFNHPLLQFPPLPVPLDPNTLGAWAKPLIEALADGRVALNDVIGYLNGS